MKLNKKADKSIGRPARWVATACGALASAAVMGQTAASTNVTELGTVTVVGHLNDVRQEIVPSLGGTKYDMTAAQIETVSQGAAAPFNQLLLRMPGMAEDSLGQLHLRGEHANIQYRIDDVLLPEGISGFGSELDPRFVRSMSLITGSLPAEYGFRTAGIIDIQTKSGFENGGEASVYAGSYDTIRPSVEYGGTQGKWNYFISGSYDHNDIGVENPTRSSVPIHDYTDQEKAFAYASYLIDDTSRITVMGSASYADYQIPLNPSQAETYQPGTATPWVAGAFTPYDLNDTQNEQNYYGVVAYQKSAGNLNFQVSGFGRESSAHYIPHNVDATLDYNSGIATDENRILTSGGLQADGSYALGDKHTLRGGLMLVDEAVTAKSSATVFNTTVAPPTMETINSDDKSHAFFTGLYLQDEWTIVPKLTLNYGARFDAYSSTADDENQLSPRVNLIWQPTKSTTLHAGYARYFTPPPLETVPASDLAKFGGTTDAAGIPLSENTSARSERANYYDAGISQKLLPGLQIGVDGYYKTARNQLDDGFFGQSLILSSFNYTVGRVRGVEFTINYETNGFATYANVAYSVAQGKGAASAQAVAWPDVTTVNYVNSHWISLDHDQRITGSFGASYTWKETARYSTKVFVDALYGSGLRQDGDIIPGLNPADDPVPNAESVGAYYTLNCGVEQSFKLTGKQFLKARLDVVNVTDNIYPLRTGTGVGVNAAQYGERRGLFGSLTYVF